MILECQKVSKIYQSRKSVVPALQDVTFSVQAQEFVCIVGPSGCGKTTLLKLVAGLLEPDSGYIRFPSNPPKGTLKTAMVFQEHGLYPWLSILDNVAFGLEMQGVARKKRHARALDFIEQVGLGGFADKFPHELSTGMRQRVGIARAFLTRAEILLMDEPFGSLDSQTKMVMQQQLLSIWKEHRPTVIYVTHDIEEAILLGDRVLVMTGRPGRIREEISVQLERPRDPFERDRQEIAKKKWHIWKMLKDEVWESLSIPE